MERTTRLKAVLAMSPLEFFTNERMGTDPVTSGLESRVQNTFWNLGAKNIWAVVKMLAETRTLQSFQRRKAPGYHVQNFGQKAWDATLKALASEGIEFPIDPELLRPEPVRLNFAALVDFGNLESGAWFVLPQDIEGLGEENRLLPIKMKIDTHGHFVDLTVAHRTNQFRSVTGDEPMMVIEVHKPQFITIR